MELRISMWSLVRELRASGVTILLTTHYIDEAEQMADRIGVVNGGQLILVEEKSKLMNQLGIKQLTLELKGELRELPAALQSYKLELAVGGAQLVYTYDAAEENNGIAQLLEDLSREGIAYRDLNTKQSSLEEIFVNLVRSP